jgi:hypothetical protein
MSIKTRATKKQACPSSQGVPWKRVTVLQTPCPTSPTLSLIVLQDFDLALLKAHGIREQRHE